MALWTHYTHARTRTHVYINIMCFSNDRSVQKRLSKVWTYLIDAVVLNMLSMLSGNRNTLFNLEDEYQQAAVN